MEASRTLVVPRYRAFLSYSHKDEHFAGRLHRRLEGYRVPRAVVGQPTVLGPVPASLAPVFRDREELPAAVDLGEEVGRALADAASLVVLCSPAAASSRWVRKEIETFLAASPGRPVLAVLVPGAGVDCLAQLLADGEREPIAADFNPAGDGPRFGLLKLVAGITAVPLDALIRRDAQRRLRRVMAVTLVSLIGMLVFAAVAVVAIEARRQAGVERDRAEGLVEFMLTDLRTKLEGVGRLDVLGAVNDRALAHYASQDLASLPAASIERRAHLLHLMGADELKAGHADQAFAKWQEAHRATSALLARAPDEPGRIFGHAQSEFWLGYAAFERGDLAAARAYFGAYRKLADRLVAIEPAEAKYWQEVAYARGNLCAVNLADARIAPLATAASCRDALRRMEEAVRRLPAERADAGAVEVGNYHAWLAGALAQAGDLRGAEAEYLAQARITDGLLGRDPRNLELRDTWIVTQFSLADIEGRTGRIREARARLARAGEAIARMRAFDPANTIWAERARRVDTDLRRFKQEGE